MAFREPLRNLDNLFFSHTIDEDIGPRVEQDRPPYRVVPPVIMGQASETCFDTSYHYGYIIEDFPYPVSIDDRCPVRPESRLASR